MPKICCCFCCCFWVMFFVSVLPNLRGLAPLKVAEVEHPQLTSASKQKEGLGR